ncbi:hypothetical protein RHSIM_Rhsim10G0196100 [Rhododendron simsii]|uniref:Uncharacterized protein n=1 Tax=Rhododendron simsii TaxID=118357 RepID=A0A834GAU5_RHOSS|nr:hypothetical protein RHSIM_Rhsim10G0196100 [Rhododendron simsii]
MEETTIEEHGRSLAAPIIFTIVVAFQLMSRFIEHKKKKGSKSGVENQLRREIKQMYKEASSLSQSENHGHVLHHLHECTWDYALLSWRPSTFAQAAKLRRMAASKEKDLAKIIMKASDPPPLQAEYIIKLKMDRAFLIVCFEGTGIKYLPRIPWALRCYKT